MGPGRPETCHAPSAGARSPPCGFRVSNWGGEPESSGGLELLSEGYTPVGQPVDVYVTKGHAYVVSVSHLVRLGGLSVFDVSDPRNPVLEKTISLPGDNYWNGVWAKGDALYVGSNEAGTLNVSNSYGGYVVVDVTDLDNVRELGAYLRPDLSFSHHSAVGTFAGRTIAFEGGEGNYSHLRVLDVTHPERIVKIGEFRTHRPLTSMHNLILRGNLLYVAWYHDGLRVLDVSNPTRPKQVAHYNTFRETDPHRYDSPFEGALGIRVPGDGHVYVTDSSRGLLIFKEL
jgi:hypothetical protein